MDIESNYLDKKERRTDRDNENEDVEHLTSFEVILKTI